MSSMVTTKAQRHKVTPLDSEACRSFWWLRGLVVDSARYYEVR